MGLMYEEERRKYHRKNERLGGSQESEVKESQHKEMMVGLLKKFNFIVPAKATGHATTSTCAERYYK